MTTSATSVWDHWEDRHNCTQIVASAEEGILLFWSSAATDDVEALFKLDNSGALCILVNSSNL
jgi:hypothetical protein